MKKSNYPEEYKQKLLSKKDKGDNVYVFNELSLEITRKCPLSCQHCLKGKAQNVSMSKKVMDDFFRHTMGIRYFSLSSGETTFAVEQIKMLNQSLREFKPTIENAFIYTNGIGITDEYVQELLKLKEYVIEICNSLHDGNAGFSNEVGFMGKEISKKKLPLKIYVSNDIYHKQARQALFEKNPVYTKDNLVEGIEKLTQNFPVTFFESGVIYNKGNAQQLQGVKKYNPPTFAPLIWSTNVLGVNVVHTFPHLGVYYDGSIGELTCSYEEQDKFAVKPSDKLMLDRLLQLPQAKFVEGSRKDFIRAVTKQQTSLYYHRLNPFNYTKKCTSNEIEK